MSKGNDSRTDPGRDPGSRSDGDTDRSSRRNSRSSVRMTVERARAIQARTDQTDTNQDFKARAMAAADRSGDDE